jgi:hypothetical protein
LELQIKIGNLVDLNAFFTQLNDKWLEAGGRVSVSSFNEETLSHSSIQKNLLTEGKKEIDFTNKIARDLQYSGLTSDIDTLEHFIYEELTEKTRI